LQAKRGETKPEKARRRGCLVESRKTIASLYDGFSLRLFRLPSFSLRSSEQLQVECTVVACFGHVMHLDAGQSSIAAALKSQAAAA